jgi:hypothetical protein
MAIVAAIVFSSAAVIAWFGRERHAVEFGGSPDADLPDSGRLARSD